jgi:hypothetical protein
MSYYYVCAYIDPRNFESYLRKNMKAAQGGHDVPTQQFKQGGQVLAHPTKAGTHKR